MSDSGTRKPPSPAARDRLLSLEKGLMQLYARGDMSAEQREILLDATHAVMWDDAIHIAAPWETGASLCGNWFRNLVTLSEPRPDSVSGCWSCLIAAEWLEKALTDLHE